ncbi:class I SAM-dependent methyltransferase [Streptomyces yunnanensis]|uniref:Methyltransferase domain-containing protein n=1 Tax=Streptomyces yunnanensis TaxID=156453 RepID=A0A9X8MTV2_9ACTN|nr:class I SAM-dependent methyltransferase [Streptomyces yunnanensis]SHL79500.1 Methyltransferase domain-containing protein [Streptomyces yunnanensis]
MTATSRNLRAWEGFWRAAPAGAGQVFWDADPALTAARHLPLLVEHADTGLPLVDLGCGNGTQTRYLAGHFGRVLGLDFSAAAVARARAEDVAGVAEFRRLDAADGAAVGALHDELGDCNVYLRGVLHQCAAGERFRIAGHIAALLGARGRLFAVEPSASAKEVLRTLAQGPAGPPATVRAVLAHGITPGELPDAEVPELLRAHGLRIVACGQLPLATTEYGPDGSRLDLPSHWVMAGPDAETG